MTPRRAERSLKRGKKNSREPYRRFLIYCEGKNTERIYLRGLRGELRGQPVTIEVGPKFGEPLALVRAADKHAKRLAADPDERFDHVWCVIDAEAPVAHPGLSEALREARSAGIDCVISNPCFELWLILHFRDHSGYLTSKQAQTSLAALLPGYDPDDGKSFTYERVQALRDTARKRALAGHQRHMSSGQRCETNPCTTMGDLLAALGM
ncbi:RloB family protein [Streptomyces scopuliridis]